MPEGDIAVSSPASEPPAPPPEAALLRLAREAAGLSPETAAARAKVQLGGSRWRQIEAGYRGRSSPPVPVVAPDRTLAHMAHAVGISPQRLAEVNREGAAEILREIERSSEIAHAPPPLAPAPARAPQPYPDLRARIIATALDGLTPEEAEQLLEEELRRRRRDQLPPGQDDSRHVG